MGMMIGTGSAYKRVVTLRNTDGSRAGTVSVTKAKSGKKKKKRPQYNFKEISTQILMSKTPDSAKRAVIKARAKVAMLQRSMTVSDYEDRELLSAIIHARKMVRIAKKKVKHLQEEQNAQRQDSSMPEEEEKLLPDEKDLKEWSSELSEEELKELMEELQEFAEELMEETEEEMELSALSEELTGAVCGDMDPEDLERLKKKHRADELREITEADMKYLKALFDKMEKERQEGNGGVSMELEGVEVPVQVTEVPVLEEGGNVDIFV